MSGTANNKEQPLNRFRTLAVTLCCLAGMAAGITWNIRCAVADRLARRPQPADFAGAMRWMPVNGSYAAQYADDVFATDPGLARSLLQKAVTLNPYDAASWIQLGLLLEGSDETAPAETSLLRAAGADATFLPAWSLANYYFRRQDGPRFWHWARLAAHMAPDDATPLFRLAWYWSPSVPAIEQGLQLRRPEIESQFVSFLVSQRHPQAVAEAAAHLLATGTPATTQSVLGACDWLLAVHHPELALPLWNGLAQRRQVAYAPLIRGQANSITNGDFAGQPTSLGFDWHVPAVEGVSSFFNKTPPALGFEFSGNEPEHFELLRQSIPIEAQAAYALRVRYRSESIPADSGFTWTVKDNQTGMLLARTASLSATTGGESIACFTIPGNSGFVDLSLGYDRQPGTVRPEGRLALTEVRLLPGARQPCSSS